MTLLRAVAAILAALATTLAIAGFAVTQSLSQQQSFVSAMDQAIARPAVQAEVAGAIKQQIQDAGDRLAESAGPLGSLASSGAAALAGQVDGTVSSPRFASAWNQWAGLLYSGLADYAAGRPNAEVSVSGSTVTVAVAPLVEPIVGETVAGGLTGTLQLTGQATDVSIATAFPVQQALTTMGALSKWRWALVAAAILLALVAVVAGPRRFRWAAITLLLAGATTALLWWGLGTAGDTPPPGSTTPQLSMAVTQALVSPWAGQLKVAALVLIAAAILVALVGALLRRPTVGGNSPQP